MNLAIIHDWLNGMRGGEKCLEALLEIFPKTPVFTLIYDRRKMSQKINESPITTSWIQKLPFSQGKYRYYLPLFPWAVKSFNLSGYQTVVSISHCVAKAALVPRKAVHICYCLTPMRYVWGFQEEYFEKGPYRWLKYLGLRLILSFLRQWDQRTAQRVDHFIAISRHVAERIKKFYARDAIVIYPPVDVQRFYYQESEPREDYFLIVSALVPYKRVDLAIEVFNETGTPLKIIGAGTEYLKLRQKAKKNIQFMGWQSDEVLRAYYAQAQALIFPGEEDFGIVPLEAMACGTPVIAYGKGGVLETVVHGKTGLFFGQQDPQSLRGVLEEFKRFPYNRASLRAQALRFRTELFQQQFGDFLKEKGYAKTAHR